MPFDVKYYLPDSETGWLVTQFETINFNGEISLGDRFVPRVDVAFVFHFKDTPIILGPIPVHLPRYFIAPLLPRSIMLEIKGNLDTLVVNCKPSVLSRSLKINLAPVPHNNIQLNNEMFYPLWNEMKHLKSTDDRIVCFSVFVNNLQDGDYYRDIIDIAFDNIVEKSISMSLTEILGELKINERTLQRHFINRVGVGPKLLARIARVNYLWDQIEKQKTTDYQDLVFFGNYFDQTHFIKDFKNLVGETPSYFLKRNLQIVKMISGK